MSKESKRNLESLKKKIEEAKKKGVFINVSTKKERKEGYPDFFYDKTNHLTYKKEDIDIYEKILSDLSLKKGEITKEEKKQRGKKKNSMAQKIAIKMKDYDEEAKKKKFHGEDENSGPYINIATKRWIKYGNPGYNYDVDNALAFTDDNKDLYNEIITELEWKKGEIVRIEGEVRKKTEKEKKKDLSKAGKAEEKELSSEEKELAKKEKRKRISDLKKAWKFHEEKNEEEKYQKSKRGAFLNVVTHKYVMGDQDKYRYKNNPEGVSGLAYEKGNKKAFRLYKEAVEVLFG